MNPDQLDEKREGYEDEMLDWSISKLLNECQAYGIDVESWMKEQILEKYMRKWSEYE